MRELPPDLVNQLRIARRIEEMAEGLHRQRDAITATGSLMLAAVEVGWTRVEIGAVLGMNHQTVAARVATARRREHLAQAALQVVPTASHAAKSAAPGWSVDLKTRRCRQGRAPRAGKIILRPLVTGLDR